MNRSHTAHAEPSILFRHEVLAVIVRVCTPDPAQTSTSSSPHPQLQILLRRRARPPFAGMLSLPSGAVALDADMPETLRLRLAALAGCIPIKHLEQVSTYSEPQRDPAQRTIATSYLGLVNQSDSSINTTLYPDMEWLDVKHLPDLAFDHSTALTDALQRLRAKLSYTNIGFALAPGTFTMGELQGIYEAVLEHRIDVTNLRRILTRRKQIEKIGLAQPSGSRGGRPAALYHFTTNTYEVTDPFATLAPRQHCTPNDHNKPHSQ